MISQTIRVIPHLQDICQNCFLFRAKAVHFFVQPTIPGSFLNITFSDTLRNTCPSVFPIFSITVPNTLSRSTSSATVRYIPVCCSLKVVPVELVKAKEIMELVEVKLNETNDIQQAEIEQYHILKQT